MNAAQLDTSLLVYEAGVDLRRSYAARSHVFGLADALERHWQGPFRVLVPAFGEFVDHPDSAMVCEVPVGACRLGGFMRYEVEKLRCLWKWRHEQRSLTLLTRFSLINVGALAARVLGARVVLEVNGLPHHELRLRGGLAAWAWPALISLWAQAKVSHAVVSVSQGIADSLECLGVSSAVIPNGVDPGEFELCGPKETGTGHVLYVGSLAPWQDVELLVHAVHRLVAEGGQPWRLTIVGDGERLDAVRDLSRSLGLERVVEFTGALDRAAVRQWLDRASVCVVPRAPDAPPGSPLKLFEYLAANRPTVIAGLDGMAPVSTPLLIDYRPGDVESLARAITTADDVSSLRAQEITRLRARIGWDERAQRVIGVLSEAGR